MNQRIVWRIISRGLLGLAGLGGIIASSAQSTNVAFGPPAAWVQEVAWAAPIHWTPGEKSEGTRFLLYEFQERPKHAEQFIRIITRMENEAGVQDSGSLQFTFDPNFQELRLHRLQIHRAGKILDRLDRSKVRMIQPEPDLDGHIITGEQTALVFVEDLRVGDALEYAYTLQGANPILAGHYANRLRVQSSAPVTRQKYRVVWENHVPLQLRSHQVNVPPEIRPQSNGVDYTWNFTNLTAISYEDCQPPSFEPYPYVEMSDFADWGAVVNWALPLYATAPAPAPPELQELLAQWRSTAQSPEELARLALQFVQDELRYTGLELGPDSYRPTDPLETFQKRFGDCKGKVALFCFLLHELNLKAEPALVHSYDREAVGQRLPSPFAFNHVIAKLDLAGKVVWVDPTLSHQGGTLWQRYLPPYGKALVVQAGNATLEDVPRARADTGSQQRVAATARIKDYDTPVTFAVRTEYRGGSADNMREDIARSVPAQLTEKYLNYYARFYPSIKTNGLLQITDNRLQNLVTVEESYLITNLWEFDEKTKQHYAYFHADNLYDILTEPDTRLRKTPLHIAYPLQREQELTVHLPDPDWTATDTEQTIEHDAFYFNYHTTLKGTTAHFKYECRTKLAELAPELVPSYLTKLEEMEDLLTDRLHRPDGAAAGFLASLNWLMVIVALFSLSGVAVGCGWYWQRTKAATARNTIPPLLPAPAEQHLVGLGGWLILVGIGLGLSLIIRIGSLGQSWEGLFSIHAWQTVAMPQGDSYHPLYGPLLLFELVGNTLLIGLNVLALGLFFTRRHTFPRVYIALILFLALFTLVDDFTYAQIAAQHKADTADAHFRDSLRTMFYGLLWTAYMLKSRRVKLTFIR